MTAYRNRLNDGHYLVGTINTQAKPAPEAEPEAAPAPEAEEANPLDQMTKQELLDHAKQLGVTPANNDMTKAELRDSIDAFLG